MRLLGGVRAGRGCRHARAIEPPRERARGQRVVQHPRAAVAGHAADAAGVVARDRGVAVRPQPEDPHDERVAGRRALDVERPDLAGPGAAFVVVAGHRKRLRLDRRARLDPQHGLAHGERLDACRGGEGDRRLLGRPRQRPGYRQQYHERCGRAHGVLQTGSRLPGPASGHPGRSWPDADGLLYCEGWKLSPVFAASALIEPRSRLAPPAQSSPERSALRLVS